MHVNAFIVANTNNIRQIWLQKQYWFWRTTSYLNDMEIILDLAQFLISEVCGLSSLLIFSEW